MNNRLTIMVAVISAALLVAAIGTVLGQQPDLSPYYQAQRNANADLVAQCAAANTDLQRRIAELEKQIAGKQ